LADLDASYRDVGRLIEGWRTRLGPAKTP
jgi:hypothetical protein